MSIKRYKQTEDGGLYPLTDEDHDYESAPWVKFTDHQWYLERAKLEAGSHPPVYQEGAEAAAKDVITFLHFQKRRLGVEMDVQLIGSKRDKLEADIAAIIRKHTERAGK